jgi:hypothetical protein
MPVRPDLTPDKRHPTTQSTREFLDNQEVIKGFSKARFLENLSLSGNKLPEKLAVCFYCPAADRGIT